MKNSIGRNFVRCGIAGWCMEVVWTGLHSLLAGDVTMTAKTSLLMFPIYGFASAIKTVYPMISYMPAAFRGCLYAAGFFLIEYCTGTLFMHFGLCPWDYSGELLQINRVIRLDYAPVWFCAGLIFEKYLLKNTHGYYIMRDESFGR